MPPPNSNGSLHIGHAVFVTLQDIMTRFHRMRGDKTLWLPGADHAGFETQVVYQKKLEKEGRNWFTIPRAELYQEILDFTLENKKIMEGQLRKLGASCDWSREKFTLDPDIVKTVYATFKRLYDDGLVYRENRLVNWCVKHQTTLSDLEVKHEERVDSLYCINYGPLTVATVRPEPIFADVAVAVHPKDKRYKNLIGKMARIPLINKEIPIIADESVEAGFGTGAVKVTPSVDHNDFELAKKHNLPIIQIIDQFGKLTEPAPEKYRGMKVKEAREAVVADIKEAGLLQKVDEQYVHAVAVCYKCGTILEPRLLPQWYIKMATLRDGAVKAVKTGEVKFVPKRMEKVFMHWMKNLRDWNISRQIVWGIRIPVWYRSSVPPLRVRGGEEGLRASHNPPQPSLILREGDMEIYVGTEPPKDEGWTQDPDVFDTWFSSGQWPFATLGYPNGKDFKDFYPTSVMETGWDILFFWVARMIMLGLYVTGKVPFEHVYLHGLVRDKDRQKMSKSKGNVIDPLGVIDLYGADALRMALVIGNTAGNDIIISEEKIKGYRNFANKIWNASRFVLMNLDPLSPTPLPKGEGRVRVKLTVADKKTLKELDAMAKKVTSHLDKFEFHHAGETLYHYFWHTFADKIIEQMKPRLQIPSPQSSPTRGEEAGRNPSPATGRGQGEGDRKAAQYILHTCLATCLKLLHPFMPFVTETIWQQMPKEKQSMLIVEKWPSK
ncbi:valine--tRNA ligase [Candidatus Uhrbacteria bacterium RIFCSPHIGHO2_12_FULL_47_11]|nr:MAG: valine--tRNA ligase [Candidatus Uhrbacteria bacterium RIFCSPHIGHO2_02_FULL_46_47]OGL76626.1 MAG: valine--tRNA ligase [Candidatus Uhrbacteria bacterium RIFCSPHIGHO2_12_FULL_47_11]OGL84330.1 MAG: valine--tRNA ligase [Candidatus Uhrbacteria bacterium RIFCSPLOWO2_02_FULL_46_25]OGL91989.1 MAG: valine--tRNA ligase [Candidatus Uhrbacteria bacterium RIFCSPLOWO2_12_FULL_47_10]